MRKWIVAAALAASTAPTVAQEAKLGEWACGPESMLLDYQISRGDVRINNFSISERDALLGKGKVVQFTFSVANRSAAAVQIDAQVIGLGDDGKPVFAVVAEPMMTMANAGQTSEASGDAFVQPGDLKRTTSFCLRVMARL